MCFYPCCLISKIFWWQNITSVFKTSTTCNSSNWPGSNHTTSSAFVFRSINGGGGQKSYHVFLRLFLWSGRYSNQSPQILFGCTHQTYHHYRQPVIVWGIFPNYLRMLLSNLCSKNTTYLKMNSPVIVQSQIWILFQRFWNVSCMLVYHHIWNHSHQLLPSSLHIGSFIPLKLPFFVSKMIFLQSINKKFQPWYFLICLPLFMIDHKILLSRLSSFYGLSNTALNLIASYLLDRTQSVSIQSHSTPSSNIFTGIPQGSVLGLLLFSLYTSPISQIFTKASISYHLYADDTQIYISFSPNQSYDSLSLLSSTLDEVYAWLTSNRLSVNQKKLLFKHNQMQENDSRGVIIEEMTFERCFETWAIIPCQPRNGYCNINHQQTCYRVVIFASLYKQRKVKMQLFIYFFNFLK